MCGQIRAHATPVDFTMQVQLDQIFVALGGLPVLDGFDLSVESGEYVVILGPSGCGKTTTLRVISGLQRPDRGSVLLDETPVTDTRPRDRGVSMVFQHDGLYPHLTVGQSIRFGLNRQTSGAPAVSAAELDKRLTQAAELTHLSSLLDRYPDQLSGGELRRASVAKAIVQRRPVRLLDEPLSALDAAARSELQDDLLRWHETVPGTTIHVTHDGYEAMRMADRIAVMDRGRIIQLATPKEIYGQPRSLTVARAIGSTPINVFSATVTQEGTVSPEAIGPADQAVEVRLPGNLPAGPLDLAVRPESWSILTSTATSTAPSAGLTVGIQLREIRAGIREVVVRGECNGRSVYALLPATLCRSLEPGEQIRLHAEPSSVHCFRGEGGAGVEDVG